MPFIQNVPAINIANSNYRLSTYSVLIQIGDFENPFFPDATNLGFESIYRFKFDDSEEGDKAITNLQAMEIANIIRHCKLHDKDIIVHCVAGLCRSGAVAEAAICYGFEDTGVRRQPNLRVKKLLLHHLGFPSYGEL